MKAKSKILVVLVFLFLIVLLGSYSYSKYKSTITGQASTNVAKWNISVNGCNISNPDPSNTACFETESSTDGVVTVVRNFDITEFSYGNVDLTNVAKDKIAPGSSGAFVLRIKPLDSQVSIKYTIETSILDDDYSLEYSIQGPTDSVPISIPSTGYVGYIYYDEDNYSNDYEEVINFYVNWINNEDANEHDTKIGTKNAHPTLDIPIKITFEQYNG